MPQCISPLINEDNAKDLIQALVDRFGYEFVNKYASMRREDNYYEELHKAKLDSTAVLTGKFNNRNRQLELSNESSLGTFDPTS